MPDRNLTLIPARQRATLPGGTILETTGLTGAATRPRQGGARLRGGTLRAAASVDDDIHPRLAAALDELEVREQDTVYLDLTLPGASRSLRAPQPGDQLIVAPPAPPEDGLQVVLYQDESGGVSWHFPDGWRPDVAPLAPQPVDGGERRVRKAGRARFTIAARTVASRAPRAQGGARRLRGLITTVGRKVLKVLVIPRVASLLKKPLESIVVKVERKYQQELIRSLTPDNYQRKVTEPFTDWRALDGKRTLLVIHGIFSSTEGVLSRLSAADMREFAKHYDGRMIAFDQLTVSRSPEDNARFFLEQVKLAAPAGRFEFDVLCHSRGGIVARTLAERGLDLVGDHNCTFRKVFFVATPNQGSVLGDPEHVVDMLDTFTNLVTGLPDGATAYCIEAVLAVLKLAAYAAIDDLPGIAAMGTKNYIARQLNLATAEPLPPATYAAAAADYTPDPQADNGFITGRFSNAAIDRIFKDGNRDVANDLVVPFEGVFGKNGHPSFPIADPVRFGEDDHVWHTDFFSRPQTIDAIKRHFGLPVPKRQTLRQPKAAKKPAPKAPPKFKIAPTKATDGGMHLRGPSMSPGGTGGGSKSPTYMMMRDVPTRGLDVGVKRGASPFEGVTKSTDVSARTRAPKAKDQPTTLRREPKMDFPASVMVGEPNDLLVHLKDLAARAKSATALSIKLARGADEAEVNVTLHAPGFDVEELGGSRMIVRTQRDPELEKASFRLTARPGREARAAEREITANFWLGNACIGAVGCRTAVRPAGSSAVRSAAPHTSLARSPSDFVLPLSRRADCDLVISVQGENEAGLPPFRVTLRSEIRGYEYLDRYVGKLVLDDPNVTLAGYLNDVYARLGDSFPDDSALPPKQFDKAYAKWKANFCDGLRALGKKLWTLLPQAFCDEYFRLHREKVVPKSILICSDEMILPWELIVPWQADERGKLVELLPLGVSHILGRWKPGLRMKPQPQRCRVKKFYVLNPAYAEGDRLDAAVREVQGLRKVFPRVTALSPVNLVTLRSQVLVRPDVQVLHFSGHGEYDARNADLNRLVLEDGDRLDAALITGSRLAVESCPVVYLNACSAGNTNTVVGRMGGFSANFLQSGCSGVIAPYWPVVDKLAADFSLALYGRLAKGTAIGEALQALRVAHPDDPTFCAFSYFGDPWTQLDLSEMTGRAAKRD